MTDYMPGHIIGGPVDTDYDGSVLTADLAVGDTVLHIAETADFDESAWQRDAAIMLGGDLDDEGLLTGATALAYDTCDDDTGTITLSAPSTVAASAGDRVYIQEPVSGGPVGRLEVMVSIDDGDTTGDAFKAELDVALLESVGAVELDGLAVDVDEDDDAQLVIKGFPGLNQRQGRVRGYQDGHVAASPTDLTFDLTYQPLPGSTVHLYWNGVLQEDDAWSLDEWTLTVNDPDSLVEADDRFYVKYLYTDPTTKPIPQPIPASLELIGVSDLTSSGTLAMPAAAEAGDLLVVGVVTRSITGASIDDARIDTQYSDTINPGSPSFSGALGYGFYDGSGSGVPVTFAAGWGALAVFRVTGTVESVHTPVNVNSTPLTMPDPAADMGIALMIGINQTVANHFNGDTTGQWTTVGGVAAGVGTGSTALQFAYDTNGTPAGSWPGLDSGGKRAGMVIGLNEEVFT